MTTRYREGLCFRCNGIGCGMCEEGRTDVRVDDFVEGHSDDEPTRPEAPVPMSVLVRREAA